LKGLIDIEYETLKEAIKQIEAKAGTCKVLPSARFTWEEGRVINFSGGAKFQASNHMPNIGAPDSVAGIKFNMIICDRLNGKSTGTSAGICNNCTKER
jgi:hypothetical protein